MFSPLQTLILNAEFPWLWWMHGILISCFQLITFNSCDKFQDEGRESGKSAKIYKILTILPLQLSL